MITTCCATSIISRPSPAAATSGASLTATMTQSERANSSSANRTGTARHAPNATAVPTPEISARARRPHSQLFELPHSRAACAIVLTATRDRAPRARREHRAGAALHPARWRQPRSASTRSARTSDAARSLRSSCSLETYSPVDALRGYTLRARADSVFAVFFLWALYRSFTAGQPDDRSSGRGCRALRAGYLVVLLRPLLCASCSRSSLPACSTLADEAAGTRQRRSTRLAHGLRAAARGDRRSGRRRRHVLPPAGRRHPQVGRARRPSWQLKIGRATRSKIAVWIAGAALPLADLRRLSLSLPTGASSTTRNTEDAAGAPVRSARSRARSPWTGRALSLAWRRSA